MDLSTAILGIIIIALTILPMVYFQMVQSNKKKQFIKDFLNRAASQGVNAVQHDCWGSYYALGLDGQANSLFYVKKRGEKEQSTSIKLAEIEKCRINHTKRAQNEDQVIDKLELVLTSRKGGEKVLEFYSKDEGTTLYDELQLLEKWKTLVNAQLDKNKRSAAIV